MRRSLQSQLHLPDFFQRALSPDKRDRHICGNALDDRLHPDKREKPSVDMFQRLGEARIMNCMASQ